MHFDCRYLELWNACIFRLDYIVLNVRDGIESEYPSIVFLSIYDYQFVTFMVGVGVSCRNLYSFVVYLYVNGSGSITAVGEERANLSAVVYL